MIAYNFFYSSVYSLKFKLLLVVKLRILIKNYGILGLKRLILFKSFNLGSQNSIYCLFILFLNQLFKGENDITA